jgi:hypothetical protein
LGRSTQPDPIGLAGGLNLYGYAGGDPVNGRDPFGLKVCFEGTATQRRRLADSTMAATGTRFDVIRDVDGNYCAANVAAVDESLGFAADFAEMADDPFVIPIRYAAVTGSGHGVVGINPAQAGQPSSYFTRDAAGECVSPAAATWTQPSMIAHELGHVFARYFRSGANHNQVSFDWENAHHRRAARPIRSRGCGDHP